MNQIEKYETIFNQNIGYIRKNEILIDKFLNDLNIDKRMGLSIILQPGIELKSKVDSLVENIYEIEPKQYYYPFSDLHITVLDLIARSESNHFNDMKLSNYVSITKKALTNEPSITVNFTGIVSSKEAVLLKGYDNGEIIQLRKTLRLHFEEEGVNLRERYKSITAHMTFCRFASPLNDSKQFAQLLYDLKEFQLGTFVFENVDIVIHDWYNRKEKTQLVKRIYFNK